MADAGDYYKETPDMKKIFLTLFALVVACGSAHAELRPSTTGLRWQFVKNASVNDGNFTVSRKALVPSALDTTISFSMDGACVPIASYNSARTDSISLGRIVVYADSAGSASFAGQTVQCNLYGTFGSDDAYVLVASYNAYPSGRTFGIPIYAGMGVNSTDYCATMTSDFNYAFPKMKVVLAPTGGSTVPACRVAFQRFDCK